MKTFNDQCTWNKVIAPGDLLWFNMIDLVINLLVWSPRSLQITQNPLFAKVQWSLLFPPCPDRPQGNEANTYGIYASTARITTYWKLTHLSWGEVKQSWVCFWAKLPMISCLNAFEMFWGVWLFTCIKAFQFWSGFKLPCSRVNSGLIRVKATRRKIPALPKIRPSPQDTLVCLTWPFWNQIRVPYPHVGDLPCQRMVLSESTSNKQIALKLHTLVSLVVLWYYVRMTLSVYKILEMRDEETLSPSVSAKWMPAWILKA